jgi:hypothetical protein
MKILLEHEGKHIVMSVAHVTTQGTDLRWDIFVNDMAEELEHRQGVKRMSYDTWHWDERKHVEAEEYITYFYLKHGQ